MSNISLVMFLVFIAITLGITYWASRRSAGASAYFAASRQIKGWQNGIAVAGDYMSAASFLGIAGIIAFQGYDGFLFSVGWLVAYLTVLLVIAEPLRNAGKYTMADVLAYRLKPKPVRAMASLSTLTVSTFYMIAQMVGAGALVKLLLGGYVTYNTAVIGVGILMIVYVVFGVMLASTWVLIGSFYIMTTFLGFGAATVVGPDFIKTHGGTNMSAPLLAQALAGNIFFAFISSIAFATILAVVAGLTISATTSFSHDFWTNVIHNGLERRPGEEVLGARISAFVVGAAAIGIAIVLGPTANVAFLVALAFAVAASANLRVIVLSIFWRRFNTAGAVSGLGVGLLASIGLILVSPSFMAIDPPTV